MNSERNWKAQCEAEPLTLSGAIQAHGALLKLDAQLRVTHASSNLGEFSPYVAEDLLGKSLPEHLLRSIKTGLEGLPPTPGSHRELIASLINDGHSLDIALIRDASGVILELFPHLPVDNLSPFYVNPFNTPQNNKEAEALHQQMVNLFYELTQFDRVMIYVFREDGDGEVVAEARRAEVYGSYLGLRFPGSDIPHIARNLYLKNPWRMIPDSQAKASPLLSLNVAAPDLTWSNLRSVSPVHQVYLSHMKVGASLSFPIVVGGELWGLIACHHATPKNLALQTLHNISNFARHYSFSLATWKAESRVRFVDSLTARFDKTRMILMRYGDPLAAAKDIEVELKHLFSSCGLAIRYGDGWVRCGTTPTLDTLDKMDDWFETECADFICTSDSLVRTHPALGFQPVAGALGLKVRGHINTDGLNVWLFRNEQLHDVEWGGNPNKPVEIDDDQLSISPRRSFEKWIEKRMGYSHPWLNEDRLAALRLRQLLMELYG